MSLSVSSFPEASPKLAHHSKWRKLPSPKGKSGFFGALLSKGSVPFLKHIRHFTKADVKESVIHHPVSAPPTQPRHPLSVSPPSIKASSIVIDLRSVPRSSECFPSSKIVDVDASSLDPVIEISHSPYTTPVALPFPSTPGRISTTSTLLPAKEYNEISPAVDDSEPHHSRSIAPSAKPLAEPSRFGRRRAMTSPTSTAPPGFSTTTFPSYSPPATPLTAVTPTEGRPRSRSILSGARQMGTETEPPRRPRHKSETPSGATPPPLPKGAPREGKRTYRGKSSPPPLPTTPTIMGSQHQQERDVGPWGPLSYASSKSVTVGGGGGGGGVKPSELPVPNQPALLTAHMLCMRSGSRPLPTHLPSGRLAATRPRSKTNDAASAAPSRRPRTASASLAVRSKGEHSHSQLPSPQPSPPTPSLLLDGGRKSRLPVPTSPLAIPQVVAPAAEL